MEMKRKDAVNIIYKNRERVLYLEKELDKIKHSKEWIDATNTIRDWYKKGYISEPALRSNDYFICDELKEDIEQ